MSEPAEQPPIIGTEPSRRKQRAPALYLIIVFKLAKGSLLLLAALATYNLAGSDFQAEFSRLVSEANLNLSTEWFNESIAWLKTLSPPTVRAVAVVTVFYAMFSLVEGVGLILRATWAGWAAIGESAFFVPVEIVQTVRDFSGLIVTVLLLNIAIVWYLYANRKRLFHSS